MNLDELIAMEAEASEASRDQPPPPGVRPTRRNRGVVLSVRLSPSELTELEAEAQGAGMPTSSMARALIMRSLRSPGGISAPQIEAAVMSALERFEAVKAERNRGETPTPTEPAPAKEKVQAP